MTVQSIRAFCRDAANVVRRVIGVPDYDRYVAHLEARHPGTRPMSRDESGEYVPWGCYLNRGAGLPHARRRRE